MNKTIHYCWFGGNEKNALIKKCIKSWRDKCPDYQIIEWNEDNFDVNCCKYTKEAYANKKWAFVSDYCRYYVLYKYGGIYLDTDVELLKPLSELPNNFVGFESNKSIASGLIRGAEKHNKIIKEILSSYNKDSFILENGDFNQKTVCERETEIFKNKGLKLNNKKQKVCDTTVFPTCYFSPLNYRNGKIKITEETYSIHWYESSWSNDQQKYAKKINQKLVKIMPYSLSSKVSTVISLLKYGGMQEIGKRINKKIRK